VGSLAELDSPIYHNISLLLSFYTTNNRQLLDQDIYF